MDRRDELGAAVFPPGDKHERRASDPSSSDFLSGLCGYPRLTSTEGRTSTFLYAHLPTTPIDADDDADCVPDLVDSFRQVRLGSVAPESESNSPAHRGACQSPPYARADDALAACFSGMDGELVSPISTLLETTPAMSLPDSDGSLETPLISAPASTDQHAIPPRTQQHWVHPTRRASPYEYQHEHDEDRIKEEAARREGQKDEIMRKCIAERKERLRRSLIPVLDLTGDCSSEEEGTAMEIEGTLAERQESPHLA